MTRTPARPARRRSAPPTGTPSSATAAPTRSSSPGSPAARWFNQIAFLSEWALDPEVRAHLVDRHGADGLPFTTRFGQGDPIGPDIVRVLNQTADAAAVRVPWQAGDLLLVDNVRTAHSREPYQGPREIVAGLADPVRLADCVPGTAASHGGLWPRAGRPAGG